MIYLQHPALLQSGLANCYIRQDTHKPTLFVKKAKQNLKHDSYTKKVCH